MQKSVIFILPHGLHQMSVRVSCSLVMQADGYSIYFSRGDSKRICTLISLNSFSSHLSVFTFNHISESTTFLKPCEHSANGILQYCRDIQRPLKSTINGKSFWFHRIYIIFVTYYLASSSNHRLVISHNVEMQKKPTLPLVLLQGLYFPLLTMLSNHILQGFINKMGFI